MAGKADSLKTVLYALGANFAIGVSKLIAAIATGSSAMLAEAIHSFADCGNQALLLLGMRLARKPPSPDYPLGHGRAIYFWSFIVALVLFSLGGLFSIYEGVHKLTRPEALSYPWVAVGVLLFGIAAETVSLRACLAEIAKVRGGRSLWRWFRDSRQSELVVILGEDIAAEIGLALALIAVLLTIVTGHPVYDALGSIAIGLVLVIVAIGLAIEIHGLLIGQSAEPETEAAIRSFIEQRQEVARVLRLITLQLGGRVMVAVKAHMRDENAKAMVASINRVEAAVREAFPEIQWLFFEPDVTD
jgi:cation diffusion facilitator family transporter